MAPTLNDVTGRKTRGGGGGGGGVGGGVAELSTTKAEEEKQTYEKLLVRELRPPWNPVYCGDVVAFRDPTCATCADVRWPVACDACSLIVRRVAAVEGDEIECQDDAEKGFALPPETVWLSCDNEETAVDVGRDSRTFGPVDVHRIVGRVVYTARSRADHGTFTNSEEAMEEDSPVVEEELCVKTLTEGL